MALFAMHSLEMRALLSVSIDSDGWTLVTPSNDTQIVYVSDTGGNDANGGLSAQDPVQTLAKGIALLRTGKPDWLLLNRGDTWNAGLGFWNKSGRSSTEPMLVSSYGTGARPLLKTGDQPGIQAYLGGGGSAIVNYLFITGLEFYASIRDPASPDFISPQADPAGIRFLGPNNFIQIEDCKFSFYSTLIIQGAGTIQNFTIRRSVVADNYSSSGAHSQGIFTSGVNGLLLEENLFDHNGWNSNIAGAEPTIFNHNVYIQTDNTNVVFRNNISANASSHGIQLRPGGIATGNLFVHDPLGLLVGGVASTVSSNVFLEGNDIDPTLPRGFGIDVNPNTGPISVSDNVIAHDASAFAGGHTIALATGATGVSVTSNTIYSWRGGIYDAGSGNDVQNNVIDGTGYPDPDRSIASYNQLVGGGASDDEFLKEARLQSKENWRLDYTAQAAIRYIREGFGLPLGPLVPVTLTWAGGTGGWADAASWSDGVAPFNDSRHSYDAVIDGQDTTDSVVTLDLSGVVHDLTINANDMLIVRGGASLIVKGTLRNSGTLFIVPGSSVTVEAALPATAGIGGLVEGGGSFTILSGGGSGASLPGDHSAPAAIMTSGHAARAKGKSYSFGVNYLDDGQVVPTDLDNSDIVVTGPKGYRRAAKLVSVKVLSGGIHAVYQVTAPRGGWKRGNNGTYSIVIQNAQIHDASGNAVAAGVLGEVVLTAAGRGGSNPATAAAALRKTSNSIRPIEIFSSIQRIEQGPIEFEADSAAEKLDLKNKAKAVGLFDDTLKPFERT
jgi:hypothetical protein